MYIEFCTFHITKMNLSLIKPVFPSNFCLICNKRSKFYSKFWSEGLKERDHLEDLDIDVKILLQYILRKQGGMVWIGFYWLRIGTIGQLL
jgi:hypothetical protein